MKNRKEFDSIGSINVPIDKYWGASTQRSKKFFNIGKILVPTSIIKSIAIIKRSAAIVHLNDKSISPKIVYLFPITIPPLIVIGFYYNYFIKCIDFFFLFVFLF